MWELIRSASLRHFKQVNTTYVFMENYGNDPKFLDRSVWTNSADPDLEEQSDEGLRCLLFHLHHLTKYPKLWPFC